MASRGSVAVLGAGAVGCFLGARLCASDSADAPKQVTLIGRKPVVDAVQAHGLCLLSDGDEKIVHPSVTASTSSVEPHDLTILAVRAYDVTDSLADIQKVSGDSGLIVAMQNGTGSDDCLVEAFGANRVLAGTLTTSVGMERPAEVTRYSPKGGLGLSSMNEHPPQGWVSATLRATGLELVPIDDFRTLRWSKLLLNMLGAASSAILDTDMTEIVANPRLFRLEQLAFREAVAVAEAQSIALKALPGYAVPLACAAMRLPSPIAQRIMGPRLAKSRGGHSPTMRRDLQRGKTEVAFLNGAVVRVGRALGVAVPANEGLTELTETLASQSGAREQFRSRPAALVAYLQERGVGI